MAQNEGKLIIANLDYDVIKEGVKLPFYGCKICKVSITKIWYYAIVLQILLSNTSVDLPTGVN